ncbi:FTR1 family protein [Parageobacillus toebii]|uniref:FTR1 family protein n=1 Tax=Parageobacillus toebii TaxID=153151 RepID=UPI002E20A547|nr:FTR1 family protein [Parageobacillus toebii]MED4968328.1 FTR1 family protein [Parageobacillus toebii]
MAAFLMFFREAFEASMLCSILATYLILIGQRDRIRDIWTGVFAAIVASLIAGVAIYSTVHNYEGTPLELQIEGISYFLAFGMLTYMAVSMKKNGNLEEELESRIDSAIKTGSKFAIVGFTFLAVFREGLEMVVFMVPLTSITDPVLNIVLGVLGIISGNLCTWEKDQCRILFQSLHFFACHICCGIFSKRNRGISATRLAAIWQ